MVRTDPREVKKELANREAEVRKGEAALQTHAAELGEFAFTKFATDGSCHGVDLSARRTLDEDLLSVRRQRQEAADQKCDGFLAKAKQLASITGFAGRILLLEQQITTENAAVGRQLIERHLEKDVLSADGSGLWQRIMDARAALAACQEDCRLAQQAVDAHAAQRIDPDGHATAPGEPIYQMKGNGEELVVFADKLEITPLGILGFMNKGLKGTKTIMFHSITAIQHKRAGILAGYLQFTVPGGNESQGGLRSASRDENTFMYGGNAEFVDEIKSFIEQRIGRRADAVPRPQTGTADELLKLADLKARGILTDEEFAAAKAKLIS